jgi:hypothetical protein
MSVWFCIPSCRPLAECGLRFEKWRAQGYRIALLRQGDHVPNIEAQFMTSKYRGWAASVNWLAKEVLLGDADAQWIVSGGDDTIPDPNHTADEIAAQCEEHFKGTFGVMQPTGDRWGDDAYSRSKWGEDRGAMIDRIAGSPWMGREWCERAYHGNGPMFAGHFHCWSDQELCEVAEKLGVYWRRRDLIHKHEHWLRDNPNITPDRVAPQSWAVASADYHNGRALFEERKAVGFPGHEPLEER